MERITSTKNQLVSLFRALSTGRGREEHDMISVEGEVMIREAQKCGLVPRYALAAEKHLRFVEDLERAGAQAYIGTDGVLSAACDTVSPQGIVAAFTRPKPLSQEELPDRIVLLDGVQDPGNCGTIWRTADAAGFQAVVFGEKCADPLSPKVLRAAMGSGFRVGFLAMPLETLLPSLRRRGYSILSSALDGQDFYARTDIGEKFALAVGSEAHGVSAATRQNSTHVLKLPMRGGAESLNAAVAAGIMMYELMR